MKLLKKMRNSGLYLGHLDNKILLFTEYVHMINTHTFTLHKPPINYFYIIYLKKLYDN